MTTRSRLLTAAIVALVLVAFAVPSCADLTYIGETPGSGMASYTPQFGGDVSSDELWDYAYQITGFSGGPGDPTTFAIYTRFEVESAYLSDSANWGWTWDAQIDGSEPDYGTPLQGTWFDDGEEQGLVFYLTGFMPGANPIFHFQSKISPALANYALANGSTVEGLEWSAAPEPATLLLTSLGIVGLGAWRRRRGA